MGERPVFRLILEKIVKGVRDIRRPWCAMILAGVLFSLFLALLLSFSLSPAHISLVHGEEGPLIRLISHTDDPYWLRVVGFIGWFAALGGFSLLGLGGLRLFLRWTAGDGATR
ncbi:hypothetical protein SAMN04488025_10954 [Planifilum fulgidum]|jgi:hypothetical protein|uniref:Uncharacterized protein n=1 Tax=Planifilum fulgidum TaxID=201973 RepID=A0A1I2MPT4_9BACL|nr:hypothetical protein [Planifilum fulgidum]SFF93575.1 hypothetical protein SAMN04488025_10954 [Planifilum fulgidum]